MNLEIKQGDCLEVLKTLPSESINCCITSPPYWGLRDYGTGEWIGGDPACSHKRDSKQSELTQTGHRNLEGAVGDGIYKDKCKRCGSVRKDNQLGLEATPEDYVKNLVEVFRSIKRILMNDGTLWLNLGDSYYRNASDQPEQKGKLNTDGINKRYGFSNTNKVKSETLKPCWNPLAGGFCLASRRMVFTPRHHMAQAEPNARERYGQMHKGTRIHFSYE